MGFVKNILYKVSRVKMLSLFKNQTIYPYYHIVKDHQVKHIENLYYFKGVNQFTDDVKLLLKNYQPISPLHLIENKVIKNGFLITFDDGLQEIYSTIYPVLKENNISAIFFINPNFVDNKDAGFDHYLSILKSYLESKKFDPNLLKEISVKLAFEYNSVAEFVEKLMKTNQVDKPKIIEVFDILDIDIKGYIKKEKLFITKEQIQEMIDDGFYFGGHTMSHPYLHQLSHEEQKNEVIASINWLKDNFDIGYSFFAFPFSDKKISKRLIHELIEYDDNIVIFGNSGIKKDIDKRVIQRFSLENPKKNTSRQIVTENMYKYFNIFTGKYKISRK